MFEADLGFKGQVIEQIDTYVGRYEYTLVLQDGTLKIHKRKAILDLESLRPHGKVSIIL